MIDDKKNILFLTLSDIDSFSFGGIYKDFCKTISDLDSFNIFVVSPYEKRTRCKTKIFKFEDNYILKVKVGNLTKTSSKIEKGISTLLFEYQYLLAIKKYFKEANFDMVVYSTPPITFNKIIRYVKKKYKAKSYLMLKDIFPQNAVDLRMMKQGGLIHKYFRRREERLYKLSDTIGCMSEANVQYLLDNNDFLEKRKIELFPNSIKITNNIKLNEEEKRIVKDKFSIPNDSIVYIYGGNLGKPQGIDFLINIVENFKKIKNGYLLIVGDGTEYSKLENRIKNNDISNVSIFRKLPKVEYDALIKATDVGLVFLDKKFTIPNFPSRLLSYMENSMPILAATDTNTDIGEVIVDSNSGYWVESGDLDGFLHYANKLSSDKLLISQLGKNARNYLEENYDIDKNIQTILEKVNDINE